MQVQVKKVQGIKRDSIPDENSDVFQELDFLIKDQLDCIVDFTIYKREQECWIADFVFDDGSIFYVKLPVEMTADQVGNYFKPLIKYFNEKNINLH